MPVTQLNREAIEDMFAYHEPKPAQTTAQALIWTKAREMGIVILENTPHSADQTAAIRLLREAVMTANQAIATGGKY